MQGGEEILKIKDVEKRTGLSRENIRFYEKQSLINPTRLKNGYREFREQDIEILLRIKLLRSIHVPLQEIKALIENENSLNQILRKQIEWLESDKEDKIFALRICEAMKDEENSFINLEAKKYLDMFEKISLESGTGHFVANKDKSPQVADLNKRFFARLYDLFIYAFFLSSVMILIFHINVSSFSIFQIFIFMLGVLVFMLFVEPLLLSTTGTTFGKFIYGLKLESSEEEVLSYGEALRRTFEVLKFGIGIFVPYYNLKHYYEEYKYLIEEEKVPWDGLGIYKSKDGIVYQNIGTLLVLTLLFVGWPILKKAQNIPPNRGELTIEEFVENYHHYEDLLGMKNEKYKLNKKGEFVDIQNKEVLTVSFYHEEKPLFWYELKNNKIKSITFDISIDNKKLPLINYVNERYVMFLALVGAQKETKRLSLPIFDIGNNVSSHAFENHMMEMYGVRADYAVEYEGYKDSFAVLIPKDRSQTHWLKSSYLVTVP